IELLLFTSLPPYSGVSPAQRVGGPTHAPCCSGIEIEHKSFRDHERVEKRIGKAVWPFGGSSTRRLCGLIVSCLLRPASRVSSSYRAHRRRLRRLRRMRGLRRSFVLILHSLLDL